MLPLRFERLAAVMEWRCGGGKPKASACCFIAGRHQFGGMERRIPEVALINPEGDKDERTESEKL
jgi:hypothetical protein